MTNLRSPLLLCIVLYVLTLITASIALEQHSPNDEFGKGPIERDATIDALVERLADRDTTIDVLMKHLSDRDAAINVFVKRLNDQDATINALEHRVQSLEEREKHTLNHKTTPLNRIRRAENEMEVAFTATLTNHQLHVGPNTPILFDHVITNIGNAYHSHVGTFIAPVSGTYIFSATLLTWDQAAQYTISKNGAMVVHIYCYSVNSHFDSTSQTVIIELNKDDDVTIRNDNQDVHTHGNHQSSFSGYLLQQHYPAIVG